MMQIETFTERAIAAATKKIPALAPVPTPYTVIIDTREQLSFAFATPFRVARARRHFLPVTTRGTLATGDYSIADHTAPTSPSGGIAIERKSLNDLFSTLGQGRDRFRRELVRLAEFRTAAVVVEADWSTIFSAPPSRSQLAPRTVFMSVVSCQVEFPTVQWLFLPSRAAAEAATIRVLDSFWRKVVAAGHHKTLASTTEAATATSVSKVGRRRVAKDRTSGTAPSGIEAVDGEAAEATGTIAIARPAAAGQNIAAADRAALVVESLFNGGEITAPTTAQENGRAPRQR